MAPLEDVPLQSLRDELDTFDERRPLTRLVAAMLYKQGPSAPTIAEWFDVRPATVYAWLDRIDSGESVGDAIRDEPRPGRPARLTTAERRRLEALLRESPSNAGFEEAAWSPALVQRVVAEEFGVDYSRRHARRLLHAGPPSAATR